MERFDGVKWTTIKPYPHKAQGIGLITSNNEVYSFGGYHSQTYWVLLTPISRLLKSTSFFLKKDEFAWRGHLMSCYRYDDASQEWRFLTVLRLGHSFMPVVAVSRKTAMGGVNKTSNDGK